MRNNRYETNNKMRYFLTDKCTKRCREVSEYEYNLQQFLNTKPPKEVLAITLKSLRILKGKCTKKEKAEYDSFHKNSGQIKLNEE
jgi:hypothetical protein